MILDAGSPDRSAFARTFDVCVIGSGPAGLTLARRLAARGCDVALMEAGGLEWSPASQDVYVGATVGQDYFDLDDARLRMFGGSSGHWNGVCRELDPQDFEANPRHRLGAWPIGKAALDPFQPDADAILDVSSPALPDLPIRQSSGALRQVQFRYSLPTRFGEKYLDEVTASKRIVLCLDANLVDLRLDDGLTTVKGAVFRSYAAGDPGFTVRARRYALCCGGIDNARLLLNFRSQAPRGIGNDHDLVGRHFTEHPAFLLGEIIFAAPPAEDPGASLYFAPTEAFKAANDTLGSSLRIIHERPPRSTLSKEIARSLQCAAPFGDRLAEAVFGRAALCDRGGVANHLRLRGPDGALWARLFCNAEQALDPENRVVLVEARDAFGMNRAELRWRLNEIDVRTVQLPALALARHVAEQGVGRMRVYDWLLDQPPVLPSTEENGGFFGSWHHMCTTRMSDDPRQGVVDRDCRVHGLANLYVGGSSVFSSVGYANPTYTIVQLALRLGDHLAAASRA